MISVGLECFPIYEYVIKPILYAPNLDHLKQAHERIFQTIRIAQPTLPILILSRLKYTLTPLEIERCSIIRAIYKNALAQGDQNVYFLDGKQLMALVEDNGAVDDTHPNDWFFTELQTPQVRL